VTAIEMSDANCGDTPANHACGIRVSHGAIQGRTGCGGACSDCSRIARWTEPCGGRAAIALFNRQTGVEKAKSFR
jgi:hypothetical protein